MKKKEYKKPEMQEYDIQTTQILCNSDPTPLYPLPFD